MDGTLLDVDGTLVDRNDAHAHAWVRAPSEAGLADRFADVRRRIGMGGDKLLPAVAGLAADGPDGEAISRRRGETFVRDYLPALRPTPGAADLPRRLTADGLGLAVASSSRRGEPDGLLRVCGADGRVAARTSADDADRSKPDPDIVRAAPGRLGLPPGRVILVGDTPYDVAAAGRAGVAAVALRCGGWPDDDLAGAVAIYDDPADLLARHDASPFRRS